MAACSPVAVITLHIFLLLSLLPIISESGSYSCPSMCRCTLKRSSEKIDPSLPTLGGRRVSCRKTNPTITNISHSLIRSLPKDIILLDLSENQVTFLEENSFEGLSNLIKLNLSQNPISFIQSESFSGLLKLEKLDLSGTKLTTLNATMFRGLQKLERLYLLETNIHMIQPGTFDDLLMLKRLDLQTNYLNCDCHLQWITTWLSKSYVQLGETAVCGLPSGLHGKSVRDLQKQDLHCDYPLELAVFELTPSVSQVVFEGDKLPFQCRASFVHQDMKMIWSHDDVVVESNRSLGIFVHMQPLPEKLLMTTMVLERLSVRHSGSWKCLVQSSSGNVSKSVAIIVLAQDSGYCSPVTTETNRGIYIWPRTLAGVIQTQPCIEPVPAANSVGHYKRIARYYCDRTGTWSKLNITRCSYISHMTRYLENSLQMIANRSCQLECISNILSGIIERKWTMANVDDVIILSHIISDLSNDVRSSEQLTVAQSLLDLSSSVMDIQPDLLMEAQRQDQACSRIVKAIEELANQLLHTQNIIDLHSKNIALQAYKKPPNRFHGLNCTNYISSNDSILDSFSCSENSRKVQINQLFNASIVIPTDILTQIRCASSVCPHNDTIRIQAVVYRTANLFPANEFSSLHHVTSSVISSRIAGARVVNATSQITIRMRSSTTEVKKIPVYWDFGANDGQGAWLSTGCHLISSSIPSLVTFKCNHLTNFALAEGKLPLPTPFEAWLLSFYNTSVIIYLGSAVLIICLMSIIVIYIIHRRSIHMSRKMRHAVVNLCICLLLLCLVYTFGIQIHHLPVQCRIIGVIVHYLSLCTLFWITTITFKLQHQLTKKEVVKPPPEELGNEPVKPKPIIAGYLLSWGVPIIICGISGAINWTNYELPDKYCFLTMDAALMTVFVPAGIIGFFDLILFLRLFYLVRRIPSLSSFPIVKASSDEPCTEELHETQLLQNQINTSNNTHSSNQSSSPALPSSPCNFDEAYSPGSQLCALLSILLLYCSLWMAGAFAITLPLSSILLHHDVVFQCLYTILASALGIFMLVFYCVGRKDVRTSCCSKTVASNEWKYMATNGNVLPGTPAEEPLVTNAPGENVSLTSRSIRSNGVYGSKISAAATSLLPTHAELSVTSVQDCSMFYNPHQNGVAKKYWERSKRKRTVQLRKEVALGTKDLGTRNSSEIPASFGDASETEMHQNHLPNEQKNVHTNDVPLSYCANKPSLPILNLLTCQPSKVLCEVNDNAKWNSAVAAVTKSHSATVPDSEKVSPRPQDFDGESLPSQNEASSLPNGGQSRSISGSVQNSNQSRVTQQEPTSNEDSFLEQLELRIPQNVVPIKKGLPLSNFSPNKVEKLPIKQVISSDSAGKKLSPTKASVSNEVDLSKDLNGNKDGRGEVKIAKVNGTLNSDKWGQRDVSQLESSCIPISEQGPVKTTLDPDSSMPASDACLDIWLEQKNTEVKMETSV